MSIFLNKKQISYHTGRAAYCTLTGLGILIINSFFMPRLLYGGLLGNILMIVFILTGLGFFSCITYFIRKKDFLLYDMKSKSLIHKKGLSFKKQDEVLKIYLQGAVPELHILHTGRRGEDQYRLAFSNLPHLYIYSSADYDDVLQYGSNLAARLGTCISC